MKRPRKILSIVGTRPNFMKVGPIEEELKQHPDIQHIILHTGQHYDANMSDVFFRDLQLRSPDIYLNIHGGRIGDQTGRLMVAFEHQLLQVKPDMVLVVGDVNSTFGCAWVATQNHFPVAHVESGLRSFDRRMPEEINRLCTDSIADLLFTTHPIGTDNLIREGVDPKKIHMVGDIMIDYLVRFRDQAAAMKVWLRHDLQPKKYGVVTLHRPSNVDNPEKLAELMDTLCSISQTLPLFFAVHPRTRQNLQKFGLEARLSATPQIRLSAPLSYLEFMSMVLQARLVLTDSGGLQEETTFLNIPCMTLRENTERPFCISEGTNHLVGTTGAKILSTFQQLYHQENKKAPSIEGWDGKTAQRTVHVLQDFLSKLP